MINLTPILDRIRAPLNDTDDVGSTENDPDERVTGSIQTELDGRVTDSIPELHKGFIAPSQVTFEAEAAKVGDQWTRTFWIEGWPNTPIDGFLETLFTEPGIETDISIHVAGRDTQQALDELQDDITDLKAKLELKRDGRGGSVRDIQKELEDKQAMRDVLRDTPTEVFDASMYVTVRGDDRDQLADAADHITGLLGDSPANTTPVVAARRQDKALRSTSPIGRDELGKKTAFTGGAIGAMFPFSSRTLVEETGSEWGVHALNGSPVIVDPFQRGTGHNILVIGQIGSGKSVTTGLQLVRRAERDPDTVFIVLDPLEGFVGVNEALGGERIVVGGRIGLNPLEIKPTPEEVLAASGHELDPYASKLKSVMSFFDSFFERRDDPLEGRRGVLEAAVKLAYQRQGITRDPSTHGNENPTIRDVRTILAEMAEQPAEFTHADAETVHEQISEKASDLLLGLEPFREGGEFENLAGRTSEKMAFSDARMIYLDLQQQEGRSDTGLWMHLLFNAVYEFAKQTDKRVCFVIDEARYLMRDTANLEFLEQAVRHSRHYDLSIQFVTQEVEDFFQQPEAEAIADNCSMKVLHRVEPSSGAVLAEKLGLTDEQIDYVTNKAEAGDEGKGYSEALLGVDEKGWFPIHVRASRPELQVVDFAPDEDNLADLPGAGQGRVE